MYNILLIIKFHICLIECVKLCSRQQIKSAKITHYSVGTLRKKHINNTTTTTKKFRFFLLADFFFKNKTRFLLTL